MAITEVEIECLLKKQKQSVLYECKDDVLELRENGVTLSSIRDWLKDKKNIETSTENIRQFCIRNNKDIVLQHKEKVVKNDKKKLFENLEG